VDSKNAFTFAELGKGPGDRQFGGWGPLNAAGLESTINGPISMVKAGPSLTHRTAAGVAWISAFQVARQVLQIISVSVLARRVPPSAYGLMAMAVLVTNFLETIRDIGTGQALVREPEVSEKLASTVSWLNCGVGATVTMLVVALSWPTAKFFHEPKVASVLQVLSVVFFLGAISVVPKALLIREMAFREIAWAQTAGAICGTIVAILVAVSGGKIWSLVFGTLANSLTTTLATLFFSPLRMKAHFRVAEARHIFSFGMNLTGYQVLSYLSRNMDNLLVGRFLGPVPLGFYQMAYTLMAYPTQNFTMVITQVVYPALSKFHDDHERFRLAYLRTCRLIAFVTFPVMLGLAVTAEPFVRVFLGPHWVQVAPLLVIFGPLGALQSTAIFALIYNTQGRPDLNLKWSTFASSMYMLSFVIGLHWGIIGVASGYSIMWILLMIPSLLIPFRLVNLSVRVYFRALWPAFWMSLATVAISEIWLLVLRRMDMHNGALQLVSTAMVGAALYTALVLWRKPPVLAEWSTVLGGSSHPLLQFLARVVSRLLRK